MTPTISKIGDDESGVGSPPRVGLSLFPTIVPPEDLVPVLRGGSLAGSSAFFPSRTLVPIGVPWLS